MKRQRGALMFVTPMLMILIIMLGVLALDGARLYSLKTEMQGIANTAATIAASDMQACSGNSIYHKDKWIGDSHVQDIVMEDVERLGGELSIIPGLVESNGDKILGFRPRREVEDYYTTNAVRVDYEIPQIPISSLLPNLFGKLDMKVAAVARKEVIASISAAGSTAIIGGGEENAGLLGGLLGQIFNVNDYVLNVTSVESLAETTFQLGGLLNELGIADGLNAVDDLVGADEILRGVLAGLESGSSAAETIQSILDHSSVINTNIRLDDVLELVSDVQYPEATPVPVYDTVIALALNLVSGVTSITRDVDIGLGDLLNVDLSLSVNEPPSVAVGPARIGPDGEPITSFRAANIALGLKVDTKVPGLLELTIPLVVETGGGTGHLDSARCALGTNNDVIFGVRAHPKVATVSTAELLADGTKSLKSINANVLPALGAVLTSLVVDAEISDLSIGSSKSVSLPPMTYDLYDQVRQSETASSGAAINRVKDRFNDILTIELETKDRDCHWLDLVCGIREALDNVFDLLNEVLDGLTGALDDVLSDVVLGIVGDVLDSLVVPLLQSLGIHLGGMSVSVVSADQSGVVLLDCSAGECDIIE